MNVKSKPFAIIGIITLMSVTMGITVNMKDIPRYTIDAVSESVVYRIDTSTGEICMFDHGKHANHKPIRRFVVDCFGVVVDTK